MKKLKTTINKILLIFITIYLVVFSVIPEKNVVYGDISITALQSQIVNYAMRWINVTPYVWGGANLITGADCSGFVMKIYEQFGISLPHGTSNLLNSGTPVAYEDLQLGDVIISQSSGSATGRHTGIYAGDGKWVNAKGARYGTVISNIPSMNKIIGIRRMFGSYVYDGTTPTLYPPQGGASGSSNTGNTGNTDNTGNTGGDSTSGGSTGQWSVTQGQPDNTDDNPVDLDEINFDFSGNPAEMEYNGTRELSPWLFSKFSQFIDYILGIMVQGIKGAIVGWTAIVEGMVNDLLNLLSNGL